MSSFTVPHTTFWKQCEVWLYIWASKDTTDCYCLCRFWIVLSHFKLHTGFVGGMVISLVSFPAFQSLVWMSASMCACMVSCKGLPSYLGCIPTSYPAFSGDPDKALSEEQWMNEWELPLFLHAAHLCAVIYLSYLSPRYLSLLTNTVTQSDHYTEEKTIKPISPLKWLGFGTFFLSLLLLLLSFLTPSEYLKFFIFPVLLLH